MAVDDIVPDPKVEEEEEEDEEIEEVEDVDCADGGMPMKLFD